jgi:putative transcriptional regulator
MENILDSMEYRCYNKNVKEVLQVSNTVRELRVKSKMSQQELAQKANTTRQTISRIEKGENPSFEVALSISMVFAVSVNDIFLPKM